MRAADKVTEESSDQRIGWRVEGLGVLILLGLVVFFLSISWRKWCDPIVDYGQQCYDIWRTSQGAAVYHDFVWNYGPFSILLNALLFRFFGTCIMVLAGANLIVYAAIATATYWAVRTAWGKLAAFAALAVFITVFSFSHFLAIGNYNYVTPYAAESIHGLLVTLLAVILAARWSRRGSAPVSFLLGLLFGLTLVIKPEFILASGGLVMGIVWLRWRAKIAITRWEFICGAVGLVLPTAIFTAWFALREPMRQSFMDASQAWWLVLVQHAEAGNGQQQKFLGFNQPGLNLWMEVKYGLLALSVGTALWLPSWFLNQRWPLILRAAVIALAAGLISQLKLEKGWIDAGRCFPVFLFVVLLIFIFRLEKEVKLNGRFRPQTVMAFLLTLVAITMLARMVLFVRLYHLGFFQAALAGIVITAFLVGEIPCWVGRGIPGRALATGGALLLLTIGCVDLSKRSMDIRRDQTQPVGWGRDKFFATKREIDGRGFLVNWTAEQLQNIPTNSRVLVFPEGTMVNYLIRRPSIEPAWRRNSGETEWLASLQQDPPDYLVFIVRDSSEFGVQRFGAEGNRGRKIVEWMGAKYEFAAHYGGDPFKVDDYPGSLIMRRRR